VGVVVVGMVVVVGVAGAAVRCGSCTLGPSVDVIMGVVVVCVVFLCLSVAVLGAKVMQHLFWVGKWFQWVW
jgi:hypothetical protein